jgi:xanthine dehydrogenase small subunit
MSDPAHRPIRFVHRGAIVAVDDAPTTQSVLYWLRDSARCVGTKEGCNEGDCGACMVIVAERDAAAPDGVALRPVNACLQFVSALDGKALITVEDLKHVAPDRPHPAQEAMVSCHGSQCGFCTPGFTMSLAACYDNALATISKPSRQALADVLSGNLCRCTGYRPILDAGEAMFAQQEARIDRKALASLLDTLADDAPLHYRAPESASAAITRDAAWTAAPRTVDALATLFADHPDARLVAGATDVGLWVTKQFRPLPKTIRIDRVDALKTIESHGDTLSIGAGASLEAAWSAIVGIAPALREMQLRFASLPLRLAGTMGGSVANGSPIGDSAPTLLALDAVLVLRHGPTERRVALADFYFGYMKNALAPGEFIAAIEVPRPIAGTQVRGYKLSKRYDCDISAVCAGLAIRIEDGVVAHARFAFGGMAAICRRATGAEASVVGRPWDEATLTEAIVALATDFTPLDDLRASAAYRGKVAGNLLRRMWLETRVDDPIPGDRLAIWPRRDAVTTR